MHVACWISKATNTHSEYVTFIDSTTTVVARTCLIVMLYVHCFSCVDPSWGRITDTLSEALCFVRNTGQRVPARKQQINIDFLRNLNINFRMFHTYFLQ